MNTFRLAHVSFTISGDQVSPELWTGYFGVVPQLAIKKGDPIPDPTGRGRTLTRRTGVWSVSSKDKVSSDQLEPHLRYLIESLALPREDFRERVNREGGSARFFCYWKNASGDRIPHIPNDIRGTCELHGIDIDIDEHR